VNTILSGNSSFELSYLNNLKGLLFSDLAIHDYLKKELQYDTINATISTDRKLNSFSSGEQKKLFLQYCLQQKAGYIVFDNPLDHLDQESRIVFTAELKKLATNIIIIHIVNRKDDLLPFITNTRAVNPITLELQEVTVNSNSTTEILKHTIPPPLDHTYYDGAVLIEMNQVSVSYNERTIVSAIDWVIKKGEFWQLIGPNGSGKSTILSLITGENAKGYGQNLYLFGHKKGSGESIWDIKKQIGYFSNEMAASYQNSHTLEQMILSGFFDSVGLYNEPTLQQKKIVQEWLDLIGLSQLKNRVFKQLTIGQQRLALIVRAVLKHPPLVILDEPLEGLDDENSSLITQLINILITETTMTIIYVSHRIESSLSPKAIFELSPSSDGSKGIIKQL
tara:strand:- start:2172 stop:3350 length:1179 start_codon:yes stop_codon:yes gene_type:complete